MTLIDSVFKKEARKPTLEQINQYLRSHGLKPLTSIPEGVDSPALGDPDVFGSEPPAVAEEQKSPTQPKWKWSWSPNGGLLIWPVDPKYGQPHHIEVTGPNFWQLAQGRVYVDHDGYTEILIWEDRGPDDWQDEAAIAVQEWLLANTGRDADIVTFQSEGGYYKTIDPKVGPNKQEMVKTYFGYGMKDIPWEKQMELQDSYDRLLTPKVNTEDSEAFR